MNGKTVWAAVGAGLALFLMSAAPAQAVWMLSHGSAARVFTPDAWESYGYSSIGLEGTVSNGVTTAINIPIPALGDAVSTLEKCKVTFSAEPHAPVVKIEVWDGDILLRTKTGSWIGNMTIAFGIPLTTPRSIRYGLAFTIYVKGENVDNATTRHFILKGAGANFVSTPR
jgi:hypothetical protein